MLASRLLLATGDPACADALERAIYNGVLPGVSLDGTRFFYVNTLQRRTHRVAARAGNGERASWYPCACCPPNVMRVLASWPQQLATVDDSGIQLQQYAAADIRTEAAGAPDVVVTDFNLGEGMNGLALAEEVHRRWPDTGVVIMSGNPAGVQAHSFGEQERFLTKPFGNGRLVSAVRELMGRSTR